MDYQQQEALSHLYDAMYHGAGILSEDELGPKNVKALHKRTLATQVGSGMWRITLLGVVVNRVLQVEVDEKELDAVPEPPVVQVSSNGSNGQYGLREEILGVIKQHPGIRSPQISDGLGRSRSSVTDALTNLWRRGAVTRTGKGTTADPYQYYVN